MSTLRQRPIKKTKEPRLVEIEEDDEPTRFSFFDIIRMLGGFILLNLFISQVFTGTIDYHYSSLPIASPLKSPYKYIEYHYFHEPIQFTIDNLALYNGTSPDLPIYVSVNGTVYDVSNRKDLYAPGASYSFFGGKECAFALATNCLNYHGGIYSNDEVVELEPEEIRRLKGWVEFYQLKYFPIGVMIESDKKKGLKFTDREVCIGK